MPDVDSSDDRTAAPAWEHRRLCPDGACVGVLDDGGRCPLCGTVDPTAARSVPRGDDRGAELAERQAPTRAVDDVGAATPQRPATGVAADSLGSGSRRGEPGDDDWDRRELCPDGACVGVVVAGRCSVCGKQPE